MSWATIRTALKTRLESISSVGTVNEYEKFLTDNPESAAFLSAFVEGGKLNTWWIGRSRREASNLVGSDSKVSRQYSVSIFGVFVFSGDGSSATAFDAVVDAICDNLEAGDRTLGGACLSHSLPEADSFRIAEYQEQVIVHAVRIGFKIKEIATI